MTKKLFDFFNTKFPFNKDGLDEFVSCFEVKKFQKGDIILKENSKEKELRFLEYGVIREFFYSNNKEINIDFYTDSCFINDFSSLINNLPTKKNQECITDVELNVLSKSKFLNFSEKYQCGKLFINSIFEKILEIKQNNEYEYFSKSPEERYSDILKNKSEWTQKIPQYHIASYLQITPETLSRIRKKQFIDSNQ